MDDSIYLLVDSDGKVDVRPGDEFAGAGTAFDLADRREYRFDLRTRRLLAGASSSTDVRAAQNYANERFGSPERLMAFAMEGFLAKDVLADLLTKDNRQRYLDACKRVERGYTDDCISRKDPCLATGCSVEGGDEICLNPIREAGLEYLQACAAQWVTLFRSPENRIDAWKH